MTLTGPALIAMHEEELRAFFRLAVVHQPMIALSMDDASKKVEYIRDKSRSYITTTTGSL